MFLPDRPSRRFVVIGAAVLCSFGSSAGSSVAQDVTYAADVEPILYENCVQCHRPNSIAPMSLQTFEQARQYASFIKFRVENRMMPPWGLNPHSGIQDYKNNRDLTEVERQTIVEWVDAGAPLGAGCSPAGDRPSRATRTGSRRRSACW